MEWNESYQPPVAVPETRQTGTVRAIKRDLRSGFVHFVRYLRACICHSACARTAQLFVRTLTGENIAVEYVPTDTIAALKQKIHDKQGYDVAAMRLQHAGKQLLRDDETVREAGILYDSTVHLVLRRAVEPAAAELVSASASDVHDGPARTVRVRRLPSVVPCASRACRSLQINVGMQWQLCGRKSCVGDVCPSWC